MLRDVDSVLLQFNIQHLQLVPDGVPRKADEPPDDRAQRRRTLEEAEHLVLLPSTDRVSCARLVPDLLAHGYRPMANGWHLRTNANGRPYAMVYITFQHLRFMNGSRQPIPAGLAERQMEPLLQHFCWSMQSFINLDPTVDDRARCSFNFAVPTRLFHESGRPVERRTRNAFGRRIGTPQSVEPNVFLRLQDREFTFKLA